MDIKKSLKKIKKNSGEDENVFSQMLRDANNSDNDQNAHGGIEEESKTMTSQEERAAEQEACEMFMNLSFTQVIKPVLEKAVYQVIAEAVEEGIKWDIKERVTIEGIKQRLDEIH